MARLPRLYAPGLPQLVQANFVQPLVPPSQPAPQDILNQLGSWLGESAQRHRVGVHAWVLANDRILLLATPMMTDWPQPLWQHSSAWRMTLVL
ncbi:hypothetical protein OMF39_10045, partial [Bordetella pertussis]